MDDAVYHTRTKYVIFFKKERGSIGLFGDYSFYFFFQAEDGIRDKAT